MIKKFKFDYDQENDDLFIYDPKSKSRASIEMDDMVVDYNNKKQISAIELLNASRFFNQIGYSLDEENLNNIKECKLEIIPQNNFLMIRLMLRLKEEKTSPLIMIPTIQNTSPALSI